MNRTKCLGLTFLLPRGLSLITIMFLFGPDLLVRFPLVSHPHTERECLFLLDFPRPP
jgi:hypothetical protein